MVRWLFFAVVTVVLMLAAPRAAGAGVEVSGLGGFQVTGSEHGGMGAAGMLRVHMMAGPQASYGIEVGYTRLGDEQQVLASPAVYPGPARLPYASNGENHLAWLAGSLKARAGAAGDAHPYVVMMAGVADHITRGPGYLPLETVHHGRFLMALGFGVEGESRLGPVLELRAFATGLDEGAALGFGTAMGIRFAP